MNGVNPVKDNSNLKTSYVIVQRDENAGELLGDLFKNILCYCSTQKDGKLTGAQYYLKTSYVIVQHGVQH